MYAGLCGLVAIGWDIFLFVKLWAQARLAVERSRATGS